MGQKLASRAGYAARRGGGCAPLAVTLGSATLGERRRDTRNEKRAPRRATVHPAEIPHGNALAREPSAPRLQRPDAHLRRDRRHRRVPCADEPRGSDLRPSLHKARTDAPRSADSRSQPKVFPLLLLVPVALDQSGQKPLKRSAASSV